MIRSEGSVQSVLPSSPDASIQRLLSLCLDTMQVDGVTVSLIDGSGKLDVHGSGDPYIGLEDLQAGNGEGPGPEVMDRREAVLETALGNPRSRERWPRFTPAANDRGVFGVFAFPLQAGGTFLGVLSLYRRVPGDLPGSVTLVPMLIEHAVGVVLNHLIGVPANGGGLPPSPAPGPRGAGGGEVPTPRSTGRPDPVGPRDGRGPLPHP